MYNIEKNVPIYSESKLRIEALSAMEIGDSITDNKGNNIKWHVAAKKIGAKVKTKSNGLVMRIWRTA